MRGRPLAIVAVCCSLFIIIQSFSPKVVALRKIPDVDEFMIENQRTRTHTRQNYVVQSGADDEMSGLENIGPAYVTDPDTGPEELPALIVDYANMIRNDIILLDNSVETRSRKRSNVRSDNSIPCSCENSTKERQLGPNFVPQILYSAVCRQDQNVCPSPYRCEPHYYNVTVFKKKTRIHEESDIENLDKDGQRLVADLQTRGWIAKTEQIIIACTCSRSGLEPN